MTPTLAAAHLNGRNAYLNGDMRAYPVLAPAGEMPGSEAMDAWSKAARAWYAGFDAARLGALPA